MSNNASGACFLNVKISDNARKLIKGILVLDPDKRFTFAEIMNHPFFTTEGTIPATLPISTLALPPSIDFITGAFKTYTIFSKKTPRSCSTHE